MRRVAVLFAVAAVGTAIRPAAALDLFATGNGAAGQLRSGIAGAEDAHLGKGSEIGLDPRG